MSHFPSEQLKFCLDGKLDFNDYFGYQNHMDYLECLEVTYPDHAKVFSIGKTFEGRELKVVKIGLESKKPKPSVWIDGGIHAREWTSPAIVQYLIHQLAEYSKSSDNKKILEYFDIYVLPIMNPDG